MNKIRIAQVGTAHDHAKATMESLLRQPDIFDVVGYCIPNPGFDHVIKEHHYDFSDLGVKEYTLEELLAMDDLDAVTVECEEENATRFAQMFADKGVHIHLDKPGSHGSESFEKLARTLESKGLVFHLGYMYRYNPLVMKALDMVKNGELGEICYVEAQMSVHHDKKRHEWLRKFKGGMMFFLGCHDVDLVVQFMGRQPDEVFPFNGTSWQNGVDVEDNGFAVLKYGNNASFVRTCSAEYGGFDRRQLVVCGTKGSIEFHPIEYNAGPGVLKSIAYLTTDKEENGKPFSNDVATRLESEPYDRYDTMMRSFAEYVRGEKKNPNTYDYEIALFKTFMKACGAE
ncbi:MAG: Gfo/Idh/MocA family oxidoreductase [Clostridia bacterium]|nr:Gfo/Idh/MocA family oxidoreductase [Clostridia bacterium]